jgi:hypothetical protein
MGALSLKMEGSENDEKRRSNLALIMLSRSFFKSNKRGGLFYEVNFWVNSLCSYFREAGSLRIEIPPPHFSLKIILSAFVITASYGCYGGGHALH